MSSIFLYNAILSVLNSKDHFSYSQTYFFYSLLPKKFQTYFILLSSTHCWQTPLCITSDLLLFFRCKLKRDQKRVANMKRLASKRMENLYESSQKYLYGNSARTTSAEKGG